MQNYSLTYQDEAGSSWASAEDAADSEIGLLVWADEWDDHPKGAKFLAARFQEWAAKDGVRFRIVQGRH